MRGSKRTLALEFAAIKPTNKPGTAQVGAISKAQNLRGEPFGLFETPAGCKKLLKNEGGTLWRHEKISRKKVLIEIFEQCHSAE